MPASSTAPSSRSCPGCQWWSHWTLDSAAAAVARAAVESPSTSRKAKWMRRGDDDAGGDGCFADEDCYCYCYLSYCDHLVPSWPGSTAAPLAEGRLQRHCCYCCHRLHLKRKQRKGSSGSWSFSVARGASQMTVAVVDHQHYLLHEVKICYHHYHHHHHHYHYRQSSSPR